MRNLALVFLALALVSPVNSSAKPKMVVELYALSLAGGSIQGGGAVFVVDTYLILPDGTHAHGTCTTIGDKPCTPEPPNVEKRSPEACKSGRWCVYRERYYADRKGNDITLYAANGKITFHIEDSWSL